MHVLRMRAGMHRVLPLLLLLLLALLPAAHGGLQGSNVDKAEKIADLMPRFRGPDTLDVEAVLNDNINAEWDGETMMDYLINIGIIAGVGVVFAVFTLLWMIFRALCGKCCHCWRCNCCCKRGHDTTGTTVFLIVVMLITFAFCVVGYKANSTVNDAVVGSTGMSRLIPGYFAFVNEKIDDVNADVDTIVNTINAVSDNITNIYIPQIEADVDAGTTALKSSAGDIGTDAQAAEYYNTTDGAVYKNYRCIICTTMETLSDDLVTEIGDQTDTLVTDFNSTIDELETELVAQTNDITTTIEDARTQLDDVELQVSDAEAQVDGYTDDVNKYEKIRKTCFIVLFLFPLATVPFILIGIVRKRQSGRSMFTVAIYLCYIYVFCTLIIFAIHVIVTAVASDACVYGDKYESTLPLKLQECANGTRTTNCQVIEYAGTCLNGSGLLQLDDFTTLTDYNLTELIQFPSFDINASFTFSELDQMDAYSETFTVQDLGFPQCYLDYLRDSFNGDEDSNLTITAPSSSSDLRRALWIQDHIGYGLKFPFATYIGTHNSFNLRKAGTHLEIDTVLANQTVRVDETSTSQNFTIVQQLDYLGVRFLELDAHYLVPGTGSSLGTHCGDWLADDEAKTRVCHRENTTDTTLRTQCSSVGWNTCETLCVCDYGSANTGCSLRAPTLTSQLNQIKDWLDNNPDEVIGLFIHNFMGGQDVVLNDLLNDVLGNDIFDPVGGASYDDTDPTTTPWPTRTDMINNNKQVVVFANPSTGGSCTGVGPASADLSKAFCQKLRDDQRVLMSALGSHTCSLTSNAFFDHVTGLKLTQTIVFGSLSETVTSPSSNTITTSNIGDIHDCGYSPDLDQIGPSLAEAAMWSWHASNPADVGGISVAYFDNTNSNKWKNVLKSDSTLRRCACQKSTDPLDWQVSGTNVAFTSCTAACTGLSGGYVFRAPRSSKEHNALRDAYGGSTNGVFLNLELSSDRNTITANGEAAIVWPNPTFTTVEFGEPTHVGAFDENAIDTATASSFASPYKEMVETAQKLITDKDVLLVRTSDLKETVNNLTIAADDLLDTWNSVNDVIDQVKVDVQPIFDSMDSILDLIDECGNADSQYFMTKNTMCNTLVEGTGGITMAAFFIGMLGLVAIFTLGAMIQGSKVPKKNSISDEPPPYYNDDMNMEQFTNGQSMDSKFN